MAKIDPALPEVQVAALQIASSLVARWFGPWPEVLTSSEQTSKYIDFQCRCSVGYANRLLAYAARSPVNPTPLGEENPPLVYHPGTQQPLPMDPVPGPFVSPPASPG